MRDIFLGGILSNEPRGPRVISFILCGHSYCRGSQRMTPPMVNAVKCSESRINRKTKPHLQAFLNEIKTQSLRPRPWRGAADIQLEAKQEWTRSGPTPSNKCICVPMEKSAALVQKKKRENISKMDHPGSNQVKETGDTCCQAKHNAAVCLRTRTVKASARVSNQRTHQFCSPCGERGPHAQTGDNQSHVKNNVKLNK